VANPTENADYTPLQMTRSVGQLLYTYLPGRVMDWEDGVGTVELTRVRLGSLFTPMDSRQVLEKIAEYLDDWRAHGGDVDRRFPDPRAPYAQIVVGEPIGIAASVFENALVCRSCGLLVFRSMLSLARMGDSGLMCPECQKKTLRQFSHVFVHGCGAMLPLEAFLPWMKDKASNYAPTKMPLRCQKCGKNDRLHIRAHSGRARDMRVTCSRCDAVVEERLRARCPECVKRLAREPVAPPHDGAPQATRVGRVVMRLADARANDAYYPHTISILRLDRPRVIPEDDAEISALNELLPQADDQPTEQERSVEHLGALMLQMKEAQARGDSESVARLVERMGMIAGAFTSTATAPMPPPRHTPTWDLTPAIRKAVEESLAFRTRVRSRDATSVVQQGSSATSQLLGEIDSLQRSLGIERITLVEDLPVITAAFAYSRRTYEATYDEETGNARGLPTRLRPFYSLDDHAARQLGKPQLAGTTPVLARESEHEGIFLALDTDRVAGWLSRNGAPVPLGAGTTVQRLLAALEPTDRYYDDIWQTNLHRMVFGLVHSLSHAAMRVVSRIAGYERTSLSEYILLPLLGTVIYANASTMRLGGMETLVRDNLHMFLERLYEEGIECLYDPDCLDRTGACHGCLHAPEISCRFFNHGLSRAFIIGGHVPWAKATDAQLVGYWES